MKIMTLVLVLAGFALPSAFAAEERCYEFFLQPTDIKNDPTRPGIIIARMTNDDGSVLVISQEVIPLNEETDDVLRSLQPGERVCLKGTKGINSVRKFMAYSARRG
jgi:hypothetical protein